MQRLLMIDDDARLATMVRDYLAPSGFAVEVAGEIATGVAALRARPAELLILDLMLPDGDGLDVCRRLRADGIGIPILMLTAKGDPIDRVIGLEIGADDYLPKPFEPRELQARIKALLRRASGAPADSALRFGRLEIDRDARLVRVDGEARPSRRRFAATRGCCSDWCATWSKMPCVTAGAGPKSSSAARRARLNSTCSTVGLE